MLTPELIKPYIVHPEAAVSRAALVYFAESNLYENDPTLMPLVLEKLQQSNKDRITFLYLAYRFPQSAETIEQIMELLKNPRLDSNTGFHLAQILLHSDLSLLEPYRSELEQQQLFTLKHQQRIDIRSMPNDQLFQEFERYLKESYGKYYNEIDTFYGDQLVRELGRRACLDEAYILHELDSYNPDNDFGYDYIYYSQLAGEMRLESAIPFLCGFLGSDDDLLPAKAADALVRIGTEAVVSAVSEQYVRNRSHEYFGLYASDIFGKIKLPSSEAALLALLPEEDDLTNATNLANGLCEIGSIQGIPLVRQLVESGYDAMHMDLKESLYAHCIIAGQQLPELESWKSDLEEKRQKRRTVPLTLAPLVHSDKIGRNDPCPCGSGKKYKKCCGSNA